MFAGALAICWRVPLLPRNREMRRICIQLCREVKTPTGYVTVHPGFNAVCLNHWSLPSAAAKTSLDWRKRIFFFSRTQRPMVQTDRAETAMHCDASWSCLDFPGKLRTASQTPPISLFLGSNGTLQHFANALANSYLIYTSIQV